MSFTPTSDADKIDPFETKEEVEKYLNSMQAKFIKLKNSIAELEDEVFVCIIKTQKACQIKVDEIKQKSEV